MKSLEEQQEEQELQSQEQWAQLLCDAEAIAQMDTAFETHLQEQVCAQMEVERHICEALMDNCGNIPQDLFIESNVSSSSEGNLFHQILSDERDTNYKL